MTRQDIFIFDNLNSEATLYNNEKVSEFFNRSIYITKNEGYEKDNRQWKYFISFSPDADNFTALGGVGADGNGSTFCNAPRLIKLEKENEKYKLTISDTMNVVYKKIGKFQDDYMKEDGFESSEDGRLKKIHSFCGDY